MKLFYIPPKELIQTLENFNKLSKEEKERRIKEAAAKMKEEIKQQPSKTVTTL
jgi:hypothetical protein